jgi:hypothetical protein
MTQSPTTDAGAMADIAKAIRALSPPQQSSRQKTSAERCAIDAAYENLPQQSPVEQKP